MYCFSYLEPVCCLMFSSNCCFLTNIQVSQEAGQVVWYSHLFQNSPQFVVTHIVKGFSIVTEAEGDVYLEFSCFFLWYNRCWQFDLWFLCLFYNSSCKPGSSQLTYCWRIWKITLLACEISTIYLVVWTFFGIGLLWDWNENWLFVVLWPLLSFPNLLVYWV